MGDAEKMVLDVYNHIMEEKEYVAAVVNDVLAMWFFGHDVDIKKHILFIKFYHSKNGIKIAENLDFPRFSPSFPYWGIGDSNPGQLD